jgi:transcriptional antiterminator RfaH
MLIDFDDNIEVTTDHFQPGQQLYIQHGPLTGICCEVVQVNGSQKILVRLQLLQRNILVTLPADYFISMSA